MSTGPPPIIRLAKPYLRPSPRPPRREAGVQRRGEGDDVSRAPSTFKLADIKRAAKAMAGAGFVVTGVKIDRNGGFVILVNDKPSATEVSALDEWMAKHAR
jgi:hypothetical protein